MSRISAMPNFVLLQRANEPELILLDGTLRTTRDLDKTHRPTMRSSSADGSDYVFETFAVIPFSQIRERGFETHDEGLPILVLDVTSQERIAPQLLNELLPAIETVNFSRAISYQQSDAEYEQMLHSVIANEIGEGQGANFVIPRVISVTIEEMSLSKACSIFRNLRENEYGTYWTFLCRLGGTYFIGATPERHFSVERGIAHMNPISGTFRKPDAPLDLRGAQQALLNFVRDPKEINELFMVLDEELKQMAQICGSGGTIIGPYLKDMARLIHTEYLLKGKTTLSLIDALRASMFAATVTGSPVESACRIIKKYELGDRRYYGSALALFGSCPYGEPYLDSPIPIRTVEIVSGGEATIRVGGTLVRDSNPRDERLEVEAKFSSLKASLQGLPAPTYPSLDAALSHHEIQSNLVARNERLSQFWFNNQRGSNLRRSEFEGKRITIIENEDDFAFMLRHCIRALGADAQIIRYDRYRETADQADIVLIGPGPGNPRDDTPKMVRLRTIVAECLRARRPLFAVCLGHQILCDHLGFKLRRKIDPQQGVPRSIDLFGEQVRVGFYNTFTAVTEHEVAGISIASNCEGDIYALRGDGFYGVQFHPESVLSKDGLGVLNAAISHLLNRAADGAEKLNPDLS